MPSFALRSSSLIIATLCLSVTVGNGRAAESTLVASSDDVPNLRQPQVAVSESGKIAVVFGADEDIYFCQSLDRGRTFTSPVKVAHVPKLALGMRRGPRIVVNDDTIVVSAISNAGGNLVAWHSLNGGESWSTSVTVNDQPRAAREGLQDLAMGPDGMLFCTWLDLRNGHMQIYGARSIDNGKTWSKNISVYASPSGTVCECCHPSVVIDGRGRVHVMWRNLLSGNRDMYVATSDNAGRRFRDAQKLGIGSWGLKACPMDGGDVTVDPDGELLTVWRRDRNVYRARLGGKPEEFIGPGEQPSIVSSSGGSFTAWVDRRGGNLLLLKPNAKDSVTIASKASDPVLAGPLSGEGHLVLVWESKVGDDLSIRSIVFE